MSKQFLYRIQPTRLAMLTDGPTSEELEILGRHFEYLGDLAAKGIVLLAGRTLTKDEDTFGIVIFIADSEEEAHQTMENDPAIREGVMQTRLFPYNIAVGPLRR